MSDELAFDPPERRQILSRRGMLAAAAAGGLGTAVGFGAAPAEAETAGYADLTLSNLSDYSAARNNLTVGMVRTPEQFGAAGDGKTDDAQAIQKAIDAVSNAGGGAVFFAAATYLIGSTIMLRQGVTLQSGRMHRALVAGGTGCTLLAKQGLTGWMFDTTSNAWKFGLAIIGFNIVGPGAHLSAAVGGIRLRVCYGARLQGLQMNSFSDSCIRCEDTSVCMVIEDCGIQTDSSGRQLTSVCGSLYVDGTDHYIRSIQCNGGPSDTGGTVGDKKVTYPGTFYRAAAYFNHCRGAWIWDLNGEFGDVGIYVGARSSWNHFIGSRADVNAGHCWYIDGAFGNQFVGCSAYDAGISEPDKYDGAIHVNRANMNKWTNFQYTPARTPFNARYGWNDETTGNRVDEQNTVDLPNGYRMYLYRDLVNTAESPSFPMQSSGAGPATKRLASRYMAGGTWYDSGTHVLTYSDGASWRDPGGNRVGNLFDADQAMGRTAVRWDAGDNATVSALAFLSQPTAVQTAFRLFRVAAVSATGSANGGCAARTTTTFDVEHDKIYSVGCKTMAGSKPADATVVVDWFDKAGRPVGSDRGSATTNSTSALTLSSAQVQAPGNAATARLSVLFERDGMSSGETYYVSYAYAAAGKVDDYLEP